MLGRLPGIVCLTVAEQAPPLRWLTAYHGAPVVTGRRWPGRAQDAVSSVAALFGFWIAARASAENASRRVPLERSAAIVGSDALSADAHRPDRRDHRLTR